jgi:hypothetical protein
MTCLSLTIVFPQSLIIVRQEFGGPEMSNFGAELDPYLFYLYTFVVFLLPFICLSNLSELWKNLWIFNRKRRRTVGTITVIAENGQSIEMQPCLS